MQIYKVLPDLAKARHMSLWHKGIRGQWSPEEIQWDRPQRMTRDRLKDGLAHIMTPILMGEQAALYSITTMIQKLGKRSDVESQFYLTTMALDESRHTELFTRLYRRFDREPMSIRRFPSGYLFQSAVMADEPEEWLTGSLVSEVTAKIALEEFVRCDLDPVLSEVCTRILEDESRHLGFNHIFLEDRVMSMYLESSDDAANFGKHLHERLDYVLSTTPPMLEAMNADLVEIGIDAEEVYRRLVDETKRRLSKSIESGERLAGKVLEAKLEQAGA